MDPKFETAVKFYIDIEILRSIIEEKKHFFCIKKNLFGKARNHRETVCKQPGKQTASKPANNHSAAASVPTSIRSLKKTFFGLKKHFCIASDNRETADKPARQTGRWPVCQQARQADRQAAILPTEETACDQSNTLPTGPISPH